MSEIQNVQLKVWGNYACFTRPEMKVERVSYDVMTPSAARGILEAILWKPAMRWEVTRIEVLRPIRWASVRRNEVGKVASTRGLSAVHRAGDPIGIQVEDDRVQRAALLLRDVAYRIHARFHMTARAGEEEHPIKFSEMFRRRVEKGQCFFQPYLGCREFSAFFAPIPESDPEPALGPEHDKDLGWMLLDFDYSGDDVTPRFFRAALKDGCVEVPAWDGSEVRG